MPDSKGTEPISLSYGTQVYFIYTGLPIYHPKSFLWIYFLPLLPQSVAFVSFVVVLLNSSAAHDFRHGHDNFISCLTVICHIYISS